MARDASRRPTPRAKQQRERRPFQAPRAASGSARRPRKAPAPAPRAARPARSATPDFLGPSRRGAAVAPGGVAAGTRQARERHQRGQAARLVALVAGAALALALVGVVAFLALRSSPVFEITSVEVEPTAHLSAEDISSLVQVPSGSTLLDVDTSAIEASLRKNPWVGSVSFERSFPNTLRIVITEQSADMLVVMSSGSVAWYLGDAGVWIEPTKIEAAEGQSTDDAALALARSEGCLLVTGVPSTVDPVAGSEATDEVLDAVRSFREGFSEDFASKVVCYVAPSDDDVSCILESGVEVSLGSATDISTKEAVVESVLAEHPSTWYLNVRVPSNYTLRDVKSDNVQSGSGVFSTTEGEGSTDQGTEGADSSLASGGSEGEASTDGEQASGEG